MESNSLAQSSHIQLLAMDENTIAPVRLNAQWLSEQVALPFLIQTLPAHSLYIILQSQDYQENIELIEWIRGKQLQKVLDFDIWEHNVSLDTVDISQNLSMSWIQNWLTLGKTFTAERFFELDEETALLMLSKFFTILPDGLSHITDAVREDWTTTPDKRFFIRPTSSDGTDFEILTEFVQALYEADANKAGFLFSAAALLIRQETLELAQKWRSARLADQGFISSDEASTLLFSNVNLPMPLSKFRYVREQQLHLEDATENIAQFIASLDPGDGVHLMRQVLDKADLKKIASQNDNPEHLYEDPILLQECVEKISQSTARIIHSLELYPMQSANSHLLIEKAFQFFLEVDETKFLLLKQKTARISNVVASTLSEQKSYHDNIVNTALVIVRGCLNIGLEFCIEHHDLYNIQFQTEDKIENAVLCIEQLGLDYIFKIGFNAMIDTQKSFVNFLFEHKHIASKKLASAKKWFNSESFNLTTELQLVLEGLIKTIPMCHTELITNDTSLKEKSPFISQKFKAFEHKAEIIFVQMIIQNMQINHH